MAQNFLGDTADDIVSYEERLIRLDQKSKLRIGPDQRSLLGRNRLACTLCRHPLYCKQKLTSSRPIAHRNSHFRLRQRLSPSTQLICYAGSV
jgi:hypothetical protein